MTIIQTEIADFKLAYKEAEALFNQNKNKKKTIDVAKNARLAKMKQAVEQKMGGSPKRTVNPEDRFKSSEEKIKEQEIEFFEHTLEKRPHDFFKSGSQENLELPIIDRARVYLLENQESKKLAKGGQETIVSEAVLLSNLKRSIRDIPTEKLKEIAGVGRYEIDELDFL